MSRRPLVALLGAAAGVAAGVAASRWLDVVEVHGRSMAPALLPGDRLLVESRSYLGRVPRAGEIVLAADPRQGDRELIKRVAAVDEEGAAADLRGDAPDESTDSRDFGAVPLSRFNDNVPLPRIGRAALAV
jgi:nickel-type superoxide dismutase maturation protease